ncbi:MAG: ECF transporter S component [Firmicutes bacterium]|nr:ECF transporter S component [Bacillota bacterium]
MSKLTRTALLVAVTAIVTMAVNIPLPHVHGYINMGDAVILAAGLLFGPVTGAVVGGLGSFLADILLGYAYWAPWTLIIKGLEGFVAGRLAGKPALGVSLGSGTMVLGYFAAGSIIYGVGPALAQLPFDALQGVVGSAAAMAIAVALRRHVES